MRKYLAIFSLNWQDALVYRLNFLLWRLRNILMLLMVYFLWQGVFVNRAQIFGYTKGSIIAYIFLVQIVRSIVFSSPSAESIGGEIGSGDLSNYLVKPISYLKYWFTRDLASKLLNLIFASFEVGFLFILFRPSLNISLRLSNLFAFLIILILALLSFYFINLASKFVSFWTPENTWGATFILMVMIEVFAGMIFPLDIIPSNARVIIDLTPFPYLIYHPIAILIGKEQGGALVISLIKSAAWTILLYFLVRSIWRKGLKVYGSEGR